MSTLATVVQSDNGNRECLQRLGHGIALRLLRAGTLGDTLPPECLERAGLDAFELARSDGALAPPGGVDRVGLTERSLERLRGVGRQLAFRLHEHEVVRRRALHHLHAGVLVHGQAR
eukprot:6213740-Pleurochrysis_carterae.AAC.1